MSKQKVSLKDIARKAQVSTALVSYVLNGKQKEARIGEEIASKVKQIAHELNYQPNYLARSLRSGKTQTIGLIIADISNPFFASIARIIEDEAKQNGYTVIIGSSDENADKSRDLLAVLMNRQIDGFIIVSAENSAEQVQDLVEKDIPFVLLDRYFPNIYTDFVSTDHYEAAYEGTSHLIANGYRRIGMIAYRSAMYHMKERIRGYRESLNDNQVSFRKPWLREVNFSRTEQEVRMAIDEQLKAKSSVDALIFASYGIAINGLKYLNELNLTVPDDLGVVSFGQAEGFDLYYCPITYLKQPIGLLGQTAVQLLVEKMNGQRRETAQILMKAELISRESSTARNAK